MMTYTFRCERLDVEDVEINVIANDRYQARDVLEQALIKDDGETWPVDVDDHDPHDSGSWTIIREEVTIDDDYDCACWIDDETGEVEIGEYA